MHRAGEALEQLDGERQRAAGELVVLALRQAVSIEGQVAECRAVQVQGHLLLGDVGRADEHLVGGRGARALRPTLGDLREQLRVCQVYAVRSKC